MQRRGEHTIQDVKGVLLGPADGQRSAKWLHVALPQQLPPHVIKVTRCAHFSIRHGFYVCENIPAAY